MRLDGPAPVMYIPMYTEEIMARSYSIAEARRNLPTLLADVERGAPAEITRRGEPVAVVVSVSEYGRMASGRPSFRDAHAGWRKGVDPRDLDIARGYFDSLRDRSPGRSVKL